MRETKNVKMQIRIASETINLNVGFNRQDDVREAEKSVNDLYKKWRIQFPMRSDSELLAMISYQFALYYHELNKRYSQASQEVDEMTQRLDTLIDTLH